MPGPLVRKTPLAAAILRIGRGKMQSISCRGERRAAIE
jgi:hypothetical protein